MSVVSTLKKIHPGWWIGLFFVILIAFNATFFAVAGGLDPGVLEKQDGAWHLVGSDGEAASVPAVSRGNPSDAQHLD